MQAIDQENLCVSHMSNKGFVSRLYEELLQLNYKTANNQLKIEH